MTQPRDPASIERDIEQTRAQLAGTLDELAERVNPKRLATQGVAALTETPRGRAAMAAAAGVVVLRLALVMISRRRGRKRRRRR